MGLTIHYELKLKSRGEAEARTMVELLHQRACKLPFEKVGEIVECKGDDCDFEKRDRSDPKRWLLVQATEHITREPYHYPVTPSHLLAFSIQPGPGCEQANFGLAAYPSMIKAKDGQVIRTNLAGWHWASFCKTQYASNPACGGEKNFLRCHLGVTALLDEAKGMGILEGVSDESDYWEQRDLEKLVTIVGEWNEMIGGFAGRMKDAGPGIQSPIFEYPNFEHIEARGRKDELESE